ncbi:MAG: hypothetical protein AB2L14_10525 [Candidatus Xenobiia bacterium LiM19]
MCDYKLFGNLTDCSIKFRNATPVYLTLQNRWGAEQLYFLAANEAEMARGIAFIKEVLAEKNIPCNEFDTGSLDPGDISGYIDFLDGNLSVDDLDASHTAKLFGSYMLVDMNEEPYSGTGSSYIKWTLPEWCKKEPAAIIWKGFRADREHIRLVKKLVEMTVRGGVPQKIPGEISILIASPEGKTIMEQISRMTGYLPLPCQWLEPPFEKYLEEQQG